MAFETTRQVNYLYQAYGQIEVCEQTLFSILSLVPHLATDDHILIYTDRESLFTTFFQGVLSGGQLTCRPLTPDQIATWQGPYRFVHRLKINMIRDALSRSETVSASFIYLDGDTVFVQAPRELTLRLNQNFLIMHEDEGRLNEAPNVLTKKIYRTLRKTDLSFVLPDNTTMHNAGVLGLTARDLAIVERTLAVSDELYEKYPKHVMEQLAFSFVFEQTKQIYPATGEIHHYWRTKAESFQKVHQFLHAHPFAERALAATKEFESLLQFFREQNQKLLAVPGSKVPGAKQSGWRRWWKWRS